MSHMNSQQRSNSKIFAPHGSSANSRTGGHRNAGPAFTGLGGSSQEGRIRDWQPTLDKGKNSGQSSLAATQSSKSVARGLQGNNSNQNLQTSTSGSRSNLISKQPPSGIKNKANNVHTSQSPLKQSQQQTFLSAAKDSKITQSQSKRKNESNTNSSGANLFQLLDQYHKQRQGPQFQSQSKRHGSNLGVNNGANSGVFKAGLRNIRNQRGSFEQNKYRDDNSARKTSNARGTNQNQFIQTPKSKFGSKSKSQLPSSLIESETKFNQTPQTSNVNQESQTLVNSGREAQLNTQQSHTQQQPHMNPSQNQMQTFDQNFVQSEAQEEREEEASSLQPVSEASSGNPMHTPESLQQSDLPNSGHRSKGQKQPRQKSTANGNHTFQRNQVVNTAPEQLSDINQQTIQPSFPSFEPHSSLQHTLLDSSPNSFRLGQSGQPTDREAAADGARLNLTGLEVPEVINQRKDFVSPQAKGERNFELQNANSLQASAQHRPNQQSHNFTSPQTIQPRLGTSASKKSNLNNFGSIRGTSAVGSKLANFSKANQGARTTNQSLSPDKRQNIRGALGQSISVKKSRRPTEQSLALDSNAAVNKSLVSSSQSPTKMNNIPNYLKATATHQIYKNIVSNRQDQIQYAGRTRTQKNLIGQKASTNDVKILDSIASTGNFGARQSCSTTSMTALVGAISGQEKHGVPNTPSRNHNYQSGVSNKKQQSVKKQQNSMSHQFSQRGGHANQKGMTRAQRPQSKRLIDHSQPPAVKTHRTDKNEGDKNEEDAVTFLNQSMVSESSKKLRPKQGDIAPEKFYKFQQDNIVNLIHSNMRKSDVIESSFADGTQPAANYMTNQNPDPVRNNFIQETASSQGQSPLVKQRSEQLQKLPENSEIKVLFTKTDNLNENQPEDLVRQTENSTVQEQDIQVEDVFSDMPAPRDAEPIQTPKKVESEAIFASEADNPPESPEHLPHFANQQSSSVVSNESIEIVNSKPVSNEELEVVVEERDDISIVDGSKFKNRPSDELKASEPEDTDTWLPMKKSQFTQNYSHVLTYYEKRELRNDEEGFECEDMIYYPGDIAKRAIGGITKTKKECDDEEGYFIVQAGDQIFYRFEILKILGKGSFAQVVSCLDHKTGNKVAIKINRNTEVDHNFAKQEARLLKFLMKEDADDKYNIVRMNQHIHFRDHQCFVFELLNTDLFEHLKDNGFAGFKESQIQSYAYQLLQALVFLEEHRVIHCDMKPENILCVDKACQKLKVVDFGSGCLAHEQVYTYVQSRYYRAPEVILRIPYSEKVDIWSLACILAELYTGEPLFPGNNEQEQLEYIMELKGIFPESMIDKSRKKDHYFDDDYSPYLIDHDKYGILRIPESRSLRDAVPSNDKLFLDFIDYCLELDPTKRPGAAQAFKHEWIQKFANSSERLKEELLREGTNSRQSNQKAQMPAVREKSAEFTLEKDIPQFGTNKTDAHNDIIDEDYPLQQIYKQNTNQSQISRQREHDGARASCCEISPERQDIYQQDSKTAYSQDTHQASQSQTATAVAPVQTIQSQQQLGQSLLSSNSGPSLPASPLKPSTQSLLDHYNYEKHNKSNLVSHMANSEQERQAQIASLQKMKSATNSATKVEEPKIISKTQAAKPVSSYTAQQSPTKAGQKQASVKKKR